MESPQAASPLASNLYDRLKHDLDHEPSVSQEVALGKRVGLYRLKGQLGAGNFAKVKLGLHLLTHERVAIKVIDKAKLDDQSKKRLSREVSCMETLDHTNIIHLYEVIETSSTLYLVMEMAGHGDLRARITGQGPMSEDLARSIFSQITAAIRHMHHKQVIHRDLKADNVFFASDTHVKIGDFGFSTHSSGNLLTTFCGSPHYAAPELFAEESYHGHLVDIWALGVTLYFTLGGKMPFLGNSIPLLRIKIQEGRYETLTQVSEPCQSLIEGLLTVDPSSRWTLEDITHCVWMLAEQIPQISQPSVNEVSITIQMSSENTKLSGGAAGRDVCTQEKTTKGEWTPDTDILSHLERLGVPVCDESVFTGEPRNSLAGAYRILAHRKFIDKCPLHQITIDGRSKGKSLATVCNRDGMPVKQTNRTSENTAARSRRAQSSTFCTIL